MHESLNLDQAMRASPFTLPAAGGRFPSRAGYVIGPGVERCATGILTWPDLGRLPGGDTGCFARLWHFEKAGALRALQSLRPLFDPFPHLRGPF